MFFLMFSGFRRRESCICFTPNLPKFLGTRSIIIGNTSLINQIPTIVQVPQFNPTQHPPKTMRRGSFCVSPANKISHYHFRGRSFLNTCSSFCPSSQIFPVFFLYGCFVIVRLSNLGIHPFLSCLLLFDSAKCEALQKLM